MKKMILALAFMMAATICVEGHNYYNNHVTISVQTFYDELLPYGEWINTPDFGYAWRPYLDDRDDFRPYASGGNWIYTDLGWTWVSDYRWGWAAFHYGRWYFDDYLGWMWIPGNEWAPAWVTWGSYAGYWAWAPMGPNVRVSVNFNWVAPYSWWTFVPYRHFYSNNWYSYIYNPTAQITNINYITNVYNNNYQYNNGNWFYGPRVRDVERHSNTRVRKMQVVDSEKPGNTTALNNRVSFYRPRVSSGVESNRPATYRSIEPVKVNQNNLRTGLNQKRNNASGIETRASNQNGRNTGSTGMNNSSRNSYQKTNVPGQQPQSTNKVTSQRSSRPDGSNRNTGKSNDRKDLRSNTR
jgi:hypothetical protein